MLFLLESNCEYRLQTFRKNICSITHQPVALMRPWTKCLKFESCHNSFGSTVLSDHTARSAHVGMPRCKTYWDTATKGRQTGSISSTLSRNDPKTISRPHFHFISEKISLFTPKKHSPEGK